MKTLIKLLTILFFLSTYVIYGQSDVHATLNTFFETIEADKQGSGNVSVFLKGKEVYKKSFGFADWKKQIKHNENTIFRVGSVTKMYTAAIIVQMMEEGKLSLNDPLAKYFPELPNAEKITIANLLKHQSGLRDVTMDENFTTWMLEPQTSKKMIKRMIKNGVIFEPGTDTGYCNTNFVLLSYIAEKLDSKTFYEVVNTRIVRPLKLEKTAIGGAINAGNNEALSHRLEGENWETVNEYTDMSAPYGAGAIVSTASEVNVFTHALFKANLVSKDSLEKMCDVSSGMGMGFGGREMEGVQFYGMSGQIDGFKSFAIVIPEREMCITILTNGFEGSPQDAVLKIAQTFLGA